MGAYVPEETKWLEEQQEYMDRWDFKLLEPWYIKKAAEYQWKMYEGYRDDAKYILEITKNQGTAEERAEKIQDARMRRDEYEQKYYELFDQAVLIKDWRKRFGQVPVPDECTPDVLTIPNTSGALDPEAESATSPVPFNIDPNLVS